MYTETFASFKKFNKIAKNLILNHRPIRKILPTPTCTLPIYIRIRLCTLLQRIVQSHSLLSFRLSLFFSSSFFLETTRYTSLSFLLIRLDQRERKRGGAVPSKVDIWETFLFFSVTLKTRIGMCKE